MNPYIQNLNRLEFLVTFACTGRCKHCSEGDHIGAGEHINGIAAAKMVRNAAGEYGIKSIMTFGGEPLLFPEEVFMIHAAARDAGIAERQLITNGFFSRDIDKIKHIAGSLAASGVNNTLLSVDAFHQETIPIEPVMAFATAVQATGIKKFRVHPAWLVGEDDDNP
jgi:pyruvate-formate lyase-activating enzyme